MKRYDQPNGTIYEARAEEVYPLLEAGSVRVVISAGPYALGKADWDRMKVADLPAWYEPHITAWGILCLPSASVYHWGTAESWAAVHPVYLRHGWTFRGLIVWDKRRSGAQLGQAKMSTFVDVTEVCGIYQRGEPPFNHPDCTNVWRLHNSEYRNERILAGVVVANPARPGSEEDQALHPCQKPLKFYDRMIRASSQPGELVLEPFGGTIRAAVACENIARYRPGEARRYVCIEPDTDGRGYLPAVLEALEAVRRQTTIFHGMSL